MGDFVYDGIHSITFQITRKDVDGNTIKQADGYAELVSEYKTWDTWKMAPKSRPYVTGPQVKTAYVDVPGADGSLDYTEALSGKSNFANRTGQWDFILDNDQNNYPKWHERYTDILQSLHGKYFDRIILDDDPDFYWSGRVSVKGDFSPRDYNMITIEYNLDPYKRLVLSDDINWWKWNNLWTTIITFGPFQVNGTKARNFINSGSSDIEANLNCSVPMRMYPYDGTEYTRYTMFALSYYSDDGTYEHIDLNAGDNPIILKPGDNHFMFYGFGNVTLEHERGKFL